MKVGKLSPTMLEHLRFVQKVYSGPNRRRGRPTHYENLRTYEALLRRGLIAEADDAFHTTTLTEAGRLALGLNDTKIQQ